MSTETSHDSTLFQGESDIGLGIYEQPELRPSFESSSRKRSKATMSESRGGGPTELRIWRDILGEAVV